MDDQDWQFTPEQIGAFLNYLNRNPMRDWRARAWFVATVTAWLSFVAALWLAAVWMDGRWVTFAFGWACVCVMLAAATWQGEARRKG